MLIPQPIEDNGPCSEREWLQHEASLLDAALADMCAETARLASELEALAAEVKLVRAAVERSRRERKCKKRRVRALNYLINSYVNN